MKILILLLISLCSKTISSQCNYAILTTQKEVDNFPKRYPNCKVFQFIEIFNRDGLVSNLDSLKYLEELSMINIVDESKTLTDISGLNNVRKGDGYRMLINRNYPPISNLDTIRYVVLRTQNGDINLNFLNSLRHIGRGITTDSNIVLQGLGQFTSNEVLIIGVQNNHLTNTMDNVVPYNGQEKLDLGFRNVKNLSTKGVERAKKVDRLFIRNVSHCDFKELYNVPLMDTLIMKVQRDTLDYQQGFVNVTSLKRLELDTIEVGGELAPLLPALEYVEEYISITNSSDIRNLDFLSRLRVSIPPPSKDPEPYLVVRNNPNLISCVNPFICNLLRTQPKRVILENNGVGCDRATILASCLTATEDTAGEQNWSIYPNPFDEVLTVLSTDRTHLVAIYNAAGQRMELDYLDKDRLDTHTWPTGIYIVQYLHHDNMKYSKVMKQ